jgi:hypothetical protein
MKRIPTLLVLLAISACSAQPPATPVARSAGSQIECIDLSQVAARRPLPPSSILFEMVGGRSYRNDVQGSCPGIARATGNELVQTESQNTRLCRDDSVRVYDPVEAQATGARSFARCRLGGFTAVAG